MMNHRILKRFAWWLLPLLVLRAWVPMGFMLSAGEQGLELIYCSGVVSPRDTNDQSHASEGHAHHDRGGDARGHESEHSPRAHQDPPCPYSLTVAAGSQDIPYSIASTALSDEAVEFVSVPPTGTVVVRAERIRGPPALS